MMERHRRGIEAALSYGGNTHSFEDVVEAVQKDEAQFWSNEDSFIITELINYPQEKYVNVWLSGGGDMGKIEAMVPVIEAWALANGCTRAMLIGRKGWERTFLARTGWEPKQVVFEKSLNGR